MSHGLARISSYQPCSYGVDLPVMVRMPTDLKHHELTDIIIGVFYDVYNELGYGFLESTYAEAMLPALEQSELKAEREVGVPVWFRGRKAGQCFADIVVDNRVLLELKAVRMLDRAHEAQLLHYLRAIEIEAGLLLNFGLRRQFRRLLFDDERKKIRANPCESLAEVLA